MKILIVDDEEIIRKAMVKTFSKYGECTTVEKGLEALKTYQEAFNSDTSFDLIILDYSLEDLSGLDILKEIRENEKEHGIKKMDRSRIIMATGHNEVSIVKECIAAGCNNYILKPVKPSVLEEKLAKLGIKPMENDDPPEDAPSEDTQDSDTSDNSEEIENSNEATTENDEEQTEGTISQDESEQT